MATGWLSWGWLPFADYDSLWRRKSLSSSAVSPGRVSFLCLAGWLISGLRGCQSLSQWVGEL